MLYPNYFNLNKFIFLFVIKFFVANLLTITVEYHKHSVIKSTKIYLSLNNVKSTLVKWCHK